MEKDKSKIGKKPKSLGITPEKARRALVMTAREYRQTKEYRDKAKKEMEKKIVSISSDLKPFQEMVGKITQQIKDSGILRQAQYVQQEYINLLKTSQSTHSAISLPKHTPIEYHLSSEDIDKIAQRSAYYLIHMTRLTKTNANNFPVQLVLSPEGDLYRESDSMLRYPMRNEALRLKILSKLIGKPSFYNSRRIMNDIGSSSYDSFTKAIGEINNKAQGALKLSKGRRYNLIISKPYSGYMINPLYAIRDE